jgi:hypothetical protein
MSLHSDGAVRSCRRRCHRSLLLLLLLLLLLVMMMMMMMMMLMLMLLQTTCWVMMELLHSRRCLNAVKLCGCST